MRRLIVVVAVAGLIASGCGDDGESSGVSAQHNQADIDFVTGMIPHHEQAVTMAEYASSRASNQRVRDIAERIESAQDPEIEQMNGLLDDWGVEGNHAEHGGMGGHPGMLTPDQLRQLEASKGPAFDQLFLRGMIGHHRGAITASEKELTEGESPEAKRLASDIIAAQKAEIADMEALLGAGSG